MKTLNIKKELHFETEAETANKVLDLIRGGVEFSVNGRKSILILE